MQEIAEIQEEEDGDDRQEETVEILAEEDGDARWRLWRLWKTVIETRSRR